MITIYDDDLPITVAEKLITGTKSSDELDMFDDSELREIAGYLILYVKRMEERE